jgi:hypothetical protein
VLATLIVRRVFTFADEGSESWRSLDDAAPAGLWTLDGLSLMLFLMSLTIWKPADTPRAHYDSMLVKCTCRGSTYEIVRRKMLRALVRQLLDLQTIRDFWDSTNARSQVEFRIRGVKTNIRTTVLSLLPR